LLPSFDHLVGDGEHARWNCEAEGFRSLEVDDQLKLSRSQDWQVGGLLALENPTGVDTGLAIGVGNARSVADETAGCCELPKLVESR
jgi:hypothetical protein